MATPINDGGPAFPIPDPFALKPETEDDMLKLAAGMSLRDYFAAKALPTLIEVCIKDSRMGLTYEDHVAMGAYAFADAMLKAREA